MSPKNEQMVVKEFQTFLSNLQVYHWATKSHPRHEAAGELYSALIPMFDEFVEVSMGSNVMSNIKSFQIPVSCLSDKEAVKFLKTFRTFLNGLTLDPTLANIRETMVAQVSRTLYLFAQH